MSSCRDREGIRSATAGLVLGVAWLALTCAQPAHAEPQAPAESQAPAEPHVPPLGSGTSAFDHPVRVVSRVEDGRMEGEVWSIAPGAFSEVATLLARPESWCDILTLHMNVKACVHYVDRDQQRLIIYIGYDSFQTPEDAYPLDARLETRREPERLVASLRASDGPFGTSDYSAELEATARDDDRTLLHFEYGYRFNWLAESAMRFYLSTWARDRIGFSLDENQRPVRGFHGLVERTSIRYHLAVQAFLEHPTEGFDDARSSRWQRWFELTERHPRELRDIQRDDYLSNQKREYAERLRLQAQLDGIQAPAEPEPR